MAVPTGKARHVLLPMGKRLEFLGPVLPQTNSVLSVFLLNLPSTVSSV